VRAHRTEEYRQGDGMGTAGQVMVRREHVWYHEGVRGTYQHVTAAPGAPAMKQAGTREETASCSISRECCSEMACRGGGGEGGGRHEVPAYRTARRQWAMIKQRRGTGTRGEGPMSTHVDGGVVGVAFHPRQQQNAGVQRCVYRGKMGPAVARAARGTAHESRTPRRGRQCRSVR